ncbi:hypothetical protein HQ393_07240 [Chitinibacter bivalviorum]|uniref:LiaI-LiaF-like transmembrane region domain-containing protein n=1 Tax=Chitinibacter bivalviorum TaxID=2739434 RepID=A0A7H9BIF8_9NEIS|nr:DUF5668 domain-containing protein [Chitinibacter bivalviorum]QLG88066.1 hypothetical protein HQ393_07240 [Chitinibacter bivalviorum]
MFHSIILVLLGAAFLGHNLGWWPNLYTLLSLWWPLILIVVGIAGLSGLRTPRCGKKSRYTHEQGEN